MVTRFTIRVLLVSCLTFGLAAGAQEALQDSTPVDGMPEASDFEFPRWEGLLRRGVDPSVYDEPLETDRPDFTEASSVVPRGILQVETGYTFTSDSEGGIRNQSQTLPESLFRYGITDNAEFRLVWNYLWQDTTSAGVREHEDGAEDLTLGTKLALTSQSGWMPESALILDMSTPTGGTGITNRHAEFGADFLYGWDLPGDKYLAGSFGYATGTQLSTILLPPGDLVVTSDRHNAFHASVTHGIPLGEAWNMYFEYFGIYLDGLAGGRPQNYFDSGMTYLLNNNLQLDVRLGVGLNPSADDFFAGTGLSVRF